MSTTERLKRFFEHTDDTHDWEARHAENIAFVEREGGVTVTEDYLFLKLQSQLKYFSKFRKEEFETIGKMLGCIK